MLKSQSIKFSYDGTHQFCFPDIELSKGEELLILGQSGVGKTTLLQILGTLDLPDAGSLTIDGHPTTGLSRKQLSEFRNRNLGFVFQFHRLLPEFNALENVLMPAWIGGQSTSQARPRAEQLLQDLGLSHRLNHNPAELSGGEQQRVAVARALMNSPKVLFADEPSGNLDSENAAMLHDLFFELREKTGQTIVMVTHNEDLANRADRSLRMADGRFV